MNWIRRNIFFLFLGLASVILRCATDPGTSTPVAGGAVTFTYATGDVRVIVSVEDRLITAAAVLFDTHPSTGTLTQATEVESGVTVTWPEELSFALAECSASPNLLEATTYTVSKVFKYGYPTSCTPSATAAGQATLVLSKDGSSRTINDTTSTVTTQTFTSTGTWTAPTGVTSVTVECWGGGGGGGGSSGGASSGGGGGGGAYSKVNSVVVTPGTSYTVNVGGSGTGGSGGGAPANGSNGGASWFSSVGTVFAEGGTGGLSNSNGGFGSSGGSVGAGIGDLKYGGGRGGNGDSGFAGGGGSSAGTSANGNDGGNAVGNNGPGGTAPAGGGNGGEGTSGNSSDGSFPGGGGGGGGTTLPGYPGASGAPGKVILNWHN